MNNDCMGLIYTGENDMRLRELTQERSVAAVPMAGRYRMIDFLISNLVNSGVRSVGIIAQRNYHSLMDHLGSGKEWDLNRKRDGLFILPPYVGKDDTGVYRGVLDAIKGVMTFIRRANKRYVILSTSHTAYNMDYNAMLEAHIEKQADITVLYNEVPEGWRRGELFDNVRLTMDGEQRITDVEINAAMPRSNCVSMDCYIMERQTLEYLVEENVARGNYDFKHDVLLGRQDSLRLFGYRFGGYVARVDSVLSYYRHNMELLDGANRQDLFLRSGVVYTKIKDQVPAIYGERAVCRNSLVADGCIVEGTVENSILFRGVRIAPGAVVRDSIIMQSSDIMQGANLEHVILDKSVVIRQHRRLTGQEDFPVVVGKGAVV